MPASSESPRGKQPVAGLLRHSRWPHLLLAVGSAVVIGLLIASYMQASLGLQALAALQRYNQRADSLDNLLRLMIDAETAVRGYQLSGNEEFLGPYREAVKALPESLKQVETSSELHVGNSHAADWAVSLAKRKLAMLDLAVATKARSGRVEQGMLNQGRRTMDQFREELADLKTRLSLHSRESIGQSVTGFQQTRVATILLALASLVLLIVLFAVSQRQQQLRDRITSLLHEEKEHLERQVQGRTEELAQLATYLTNTREEEKFRLARELHDEMGALLTAAKLDAGWIERKLPPEVRAGMAERLTRLQDTLGQGIALKRRITNDLRPALLYDLGLFAALQVLADDFARSDEVEVAVGLPGENLDLPEQTSLALFRIVQEAFTNIRKYARARHVDLRIEVAGGRIRLEVKDDGVGFNPNSPTLARHGLAGMQHRVQMLSGRLQITSGPGAGTRIQVEVPLPR